MKRINIVADWEYPEGCFDVETLLRGIRNAQKDMGIKKTDGFITTVNGFGKMRIIFSDERISTSQARQELNKFSR